MKKTPIIFHIDLLGQKSAFFILEIDYLIKKNRFLLLLDESQY